MSPEQAAQLYQQAFEEVLIALDDDSTKRNK